MKALQSILLGTFVVAPVVLGSTFLCLNILRYNNILNKEKGKYETNYKNSEEESKRIERELLEHGFIRQKYQEKK